MPFGGSFTLIFISKYAIEEYVKNGLLQTNTLFATLHINDLYTLFPHEQNFEILQRFLDDYVLDEQIQGLTIQTIINLIQLILENQYFLYADKVYQQIQDLVKILNNKNEIFGRCFDQIFMTWNESEDHLNAILNTINTHYPNIRITLSMGTKINYLDAEKAAHINGELNINVAHDLPTEPYSLPFVYDHSPHNYLTFIRAALIRATTCCLHVFEFHNERQDIELSFSLNGFSSDFIADKVQSFFIEFDEIELESDYNQYLYDHLRQRVLEYNQQARIAKGKQQCHHQEIFEEHPWNC